LGSLSKLSNLEAIKFYCQFELVLLDEIGFGLSLDKCVVTNGTDNLIYVSPKSGCAVGAISGRPYHDKLLALPDMLLNKHNPGSKSEVLQALKLTGFFIHRVLSEMHHKVRLQARDQLITCLSLAEDL
jgi:DNA repair protein RecO (recombination protein O)